MVSDHITGTVGFVYVDDEQFGLNGWQIHHLKAEKFTPKEKWDKSQKWILQEVEKLKVEIMVSDHGLFDCPD